MVLFFFKENTRFVMLANHTVTGVFLKKNLKGCLSVFLFKKPTTRRFDYFLDFFLFKKSFFFTLRSGFFYSKTKLSRIRQICKNIVVLTLFLNIFFIFKVNEIYFNFCFSSINLIFLTFFFLSIKHKSFSK